MGQMLPYVMWGLILKLWLFPEGARVPISIDMNFLFHEKKGNRANWLCEAQKQKNIPVELWKEQKFAQKNVEKPLTPRINDICFCPEVEQFIR